MAASPVANPIGTRCRLVMTPMLLAIGAALTSGCASHVERPLPHSEEYRLALDRFERCIARESATVRQKPLSEADPALLEGIEQACEGYRRDLVALYPERLDKQVSNLLERHLRSRSVELLGIRQSGFLP